MRIPNQLNLETVMNMDGIMDELLPVSPANSGSESYRRLLKECARLVWTLSEIVLLHYYAFVFVVAFRPLWLAVRLGATGVTIGFPIAAGMFITPWSQTAKGFDGIVYSLGSFVGWPLVLFLMAERLRNLGRFTFADVIAYRLHEDRTRALSAFGSLTGCVSIS